MEKLKNDDEYETITQNRECKKSDWMLLCKNEQKQNAFKHLMTSILKMVIIMKRLN
jgi:hypothetical protein